MLDCCLIVGIHLLATLQLLVIAPHNTVLLLEARRLCFCLHFSNFWYNCSNDDLFLNGSAIEEGYI